MCLAEEFIQELSGWIFCCSSHPVDMENIQIRYVLFAIDWLPKKPQFNSFLYGGFYCKEMFWSSKHMLIKSSPPITRMLA